jgi:hypothetical protein
VPNDTDQTIEIPFQESGDHQLRIIMGPGQLRIAPAPEGAWVSGTYTDPTGNIPIRVETNGANAKISQSVTRPSLKWPRGAPVLNLTLGTQRPYLLIIEGGANEINAEFGGLPLTRLECRIGAGQARFRFGEPNPQPMDQLQITSGAVEVTVSALANANAATIAIEAGAAALHLDFGGKLARDTSARVNVGAAGVDFAIPGSTAAKITVHSVLAGIDVGDGFQTREGAYWTAAAVAGETPVLAIDTNVTLSGLKLRAT